MKRPRCDKGFPRATWDEIEELRDNCIAACLHYDLTIASSLMAMQSAKIDHDKAARCYAAIARSMP